MCHGIGPLSCEQAARNLKSNLATLAIRTLKKASTEGGGVGWHGPSAPTPPGTALSDFARRNPSEIPSQTQSVSAFLPGKVSMGTPFLRRITLHGIPPLPVSLHIIKSRKVTGRLQACRLNASPGSVSCNQRGGASQVIDVCWKEKLAVGFQAGSIHRDFQNGYSTNPVSRAANDS